MNRSTALALCIASLLLTGCGRKPRRPVVVATTANIAAIVEAVAGKRVENITLAPAGMCPGHFDIRPSHVAAAIRADLLVRQGWEVWFDDLEQALPALPERIVTSQTEGNWMLPDVHRRAVAELTELLAGLDTTRADTFRRNADRYLERIDSAATQAKMMVRELRRQTPGHLPNAIATEHQAPFVRWLGFRVVATYGRPEEFTASGLTDLARAGSDSAVGLIVDNLQSGPDAGAPLAEVLGARHVNLTNFPSDNDYPATLLLNARDVVAALE